MKKLSFVMFATLLIGGSVAEGGWGSFVSKFRSPGKYANGVTYRPGQVYIACFAGPVLWKTTTTGSVINYYPIKGAVRPKGVTWGTVAGTTYYWIADDIKDYIYRCIDNSSTVHGSFPAPGVDAYGVAFVNASHMFYTDRREEMLYRLNPMNGSIYSSYALKFPPNGLAYDPDGYLWINYANYPTTTVVNKCTLKGSVIASFSTMKQGSPAGCAYDAEGSYVWVSVYKRSTEIWSVARYDVGGEPAVEPASIGRLKALYR
jgi:sugar lactone lactonase YvrE